MDQRCRQWRKHWLLDSCACLTPFHGQCRMKLWRFYSQTGATMWRLCQYTRPGVCRYESSRFTQVHSPLLSLLDTVIFTAIHYDRNKESCRYAVHAFVTINRYPLAHYFYLIRDDVKVTNDARYEACTVRGFSFFWQKSPCMHYGNKSSWQSVCLLPSSSGITDHEKCVLYYDWSTVRNTWWNHAWQNTKSGTLRVHIAYKVDVNVVTGTLRTGPS